jgi:zinc transport system permease protein
MSPFDQPFMRHALLAGCLCGSVTGFLGVYVYLKRMVFVGLAVSETAALGIVVGLLAGFPVDVTSVVVTLVAMFCLSRIDRTKVLSHDGPIALTYCLASAIVILGMAKSPKLEAAGLDLASGNLLYITTTDLVILAILVSAVLVSHLVCLRKMLFCTFDPITARIQGIRTSVYEMWLQISLGLTIALTVRITGLVFVFGILVIVPLIAAICLRTTRMFLAATLLPAPAVFVGLLVAHRLDLPPSPTIVALIAAVYLAVFGAKRLLT